MSCTLQCNHAPFMLSGSHMGHDRGINPYLIMLLMQQDQ